MILFNKITNKILEKTAVDNYNNIINNYNTIFMNFVIEYCNLSNITINFDLFNIDNNDDGHNDDLNKWLNNTKEKFENYLFNYINCHNVFNNVIEFFNIFKINNYIDSKKIMNEKFDKLSIFECSTIELIVSIYILHYSDNNIEDCDIKKIYKKFLDESNIINISLLEYLYENKAEYMIDRDNNYIQKLILNMLDCINSAENNKKFEHNYESGKKYLINLINKSKINKRIKNILDSKNIVKYANKEKDLPFYNEYEEYENLLLNTIILFFIIVKTQPNVKKFNLNNYIKYIMTDKKDGLIIIYLDCKNKEVK